MAAEHKEDYVILPHHNQHTWETIETHLKEPIASPSQLEVFGIV